MGRNVLDEGLVDLHHLPYSFAASSVKTCVVQIQGQKGVVCSKGIY